jgi:hypothetical protein
VWTAFCVATACAVGLGGCYRSHERASRPSTPATTLADAGLADAAADAPVRDGPACATVARTLEVPAGGCVAEVIPSTAGNDCDTRPLARVASIVRVRRPRAGAAWYFLIRSRDRAATEIAAGSVAEDCTCDFHASASGGDLTAHGVGGDISDPSTTEIDFVLDGQGGAMWLRVCDGPPR